MTKKKTKTRTKMCLLCHKSTSKKAPCKCLLIKNQIEEVIDDYFDNANLRDPYDPYSAIMQGRGYLLDELLCIFIASRRDDD